jgi:glutathione S-transferase
LASGEHKSEDYLKINPQGTVPAVTDDEFVMNESRAIMCYLVNAKTPNNCLYPSDDPKARFIIDHRLFYDASTFMPACSAALVINKIELYSYVTFPPLVDSNYEERRDCDFGSEQGKNF